MRYRPLTGEVIDAKLLQGVPSFVQGAPTRRKGARGVGLRYERKVQLKLCSDFDNYMPGPWFEYKTSDEPKRINYAQPDGILIDIERGVITIAEIKLRHTVEAYFQLLDKYLPIVRMFFNNSEDLWSFAVCEVTKWYDCHTQFPCKPKLRESIDIVSPKEFGVHICRP